MEIYIENIAEDKKGKITIYYSEIIKTFILISNPECSMLSNEKIHDFFKKLIADGKNKEEYKLEIKNKIKAPIDSSYLFSMDNKKYIDIKKLCIDITGLKNLDVSEVKNMSYMFSYLENTQLDIDDWNVSNVEDMKYMFYGAKMAEPDVSKWEVNKLKNVSYMFGYADKSNPDFSNWIVDREIYDDNIFYGLNKEVKYEYKEYEEYEEQELTGFFKKFINYFSYKDKV